ncbi:hypothetical protein hrd7_25230 [Leptolinea sp. HRD-7]|nr:hypothetical protein hrd7_25230 [Leptolinea sp. HRD-7]
MAGSVIDNESPFNSHFTKGDAGTGKLPVPADDLNMILEAIQMVVKSGRGYGEVVITFKRGELDQVEPRPQLKPSRGGKEGHI